MSTAVVTAIKAVISIISDEETRKKIGWIIVTILAPLIVIVTVICVSAASAANHNTWAVTLTFNGGYIGNKVPPEFKEYITDMRTSFGYLDREISAANSVMEDGDSLDDYRIKAVFYAMYFGEDSLSKKDHGKFVSCFYTEQTRERETEETKTVTQEDGTQREETYTETEEYPVYIPIADLSLIYQRIGAMRAVPMTHENMVNSGEIYYRMKYGKSMQDAGDLGGINSIPLSGEPFIGIDRFTVPIGGVSWQDVVTSEFGPRNYAPDPYHTGIDFGVPYGSSVYSALDGTVIYVRYGTSGFGYHVAVDHGGGIVTIYAHCSKLLVADGQQVVAGQEIARVGNTGLSTNPHLHFEIRENGTSVNPRKYLPTGQDTANLLLHSSDTDSNRDTKPTLIFLGGRR